MGTSSHDKIMFYSWMLVLAIMLMSNGMIGGVKGHAGIDHDEPDNDTTNGTDATVLTKSQIGLGFGLSFLAAGFSSLGALIPVIDRFLLPLIFPGFALLGSRLFFAGTLSFAGGLLLALALWDLSPEAVESLGDSGWFNSKHAGMVVVACVVCGMLIIALTSWLAGLLAPKNVKTCACETTISDALAMSTPSKEKDLEESSSPATCPVPSCCSNDKAEPIEMEGEDRSRKSSCCNGNPPAPGETCAVASVALSRKNSTASKIRESGGEDSTMLDKDEPKINIYKFGFQLAVAIAIHNIPEGLATFVSVVQSPTVGFLFGLALCIHKVPEGLIISVPIYHATQSRWKAFVVTLIIGMISQPLGALIGYGVYTRSYNEGANGLVLSIVAGAMIYISLKGMLPMARLYDPKDRCVTVCTLVGVIVLMTSTALFSET